MIPWFNPFYQPLSLDWKNPIFDSVESPIDPSDFRQLTLSYVNTIGPEFEVYPDAEAIGARPIHPSVLHFPKGWNGYEYWMAYTPLKASEDITIENPCLAVSNDLINWIPVPGVENPLEPGPTDGSWNSDTYLMHYDGWLYCFWRHQQGATNNTLWYRRSWNGVDWEEKVNCGVFTLPDNMIASPAIIRSFDNSEWWLYGIRENGPYTLEKYTSDSLTGPWVKQGTVTLENFIGTNPWHFSLRRYGERLVLLISDGGQNGGNNYFAESLDGDTFSFDSQKPIITCVRADANAAIATYKCDFLPIFDSGKLRCFLFLATTADYNYGWADWDNETSQERYDRIMPDAITPQLPYLAGDNFIRADGAPGNLTSGQTWTVVSGAWAIDSNTLRATSDNNNNIILTDIGQSNVKIGFRASAWQSSGRESWLRLRVNAANNNWLRLGQSQSNAIFLQEFAGSIVTVKRYRYQIVATDWIEVECNGPRITVYINGAEVFYHETSVAETNTRFGFQNSSAITSFDAFYIESLP